MHRNTLLPTASAMLLVLLGGLTQAQQIKAFDFFPHRQPISQTPPQPTMNNPQPLVESNTKFAFKLWQEILHQEVGKNVFVSPSSIAFALGMAYNGAGGKTQQAMAESLELVGMSTTEINQAYQSLQTSLEKADPEVTLSIANSLWAREGFPLERDFLATNQEFFDARVSQLDFGDPQSPEIINDWVREQTNGKIGEIVDSLKPADVLFLINAIYFKGNWQNKFDENLTTEKPFYLTDGTTKEHPMMFQRNEYRYLETEEFQAVSLPYGEGNLSMYIFLPRAESNLDDFYQQLDFENWQTWMARFRRRDGVMELPRFKLEYDIKLSETLKALGMGEMFSRATADFSKMTPAKVAVDEVKHKTFVEVNEEGTEAAAVTSIGIRATSIPAPPFEMKVDRPFFCVIRDNQTGTILFMGSILEPK